MNIHTFIEAHWQKPKWWLLILLTPFSLLFYLITFCRKKLYDFNIFKSYTLPVPVVVIGNIHSGGTGKTPITASLVQSLQKRGIRVGIISRGYGRSLKSVHVLNHHSSALEAGDEPLMLYQQTHAPIAVGSHRFQAALALLNAHPEIDLIVCDDGLQHYALRRQLEIVIYPARDWNRKPQLLPNGSLREPLSRLHHIDALIVSNGEKGLAQKTAQTLHLPTHIAVFDSTINTPYPYRLHCPSEYLNDISQTHHRSCAAIAGVANPERFFQSLSQLGIHLNQTICLADHAMITEQDWPKADFIFITEKDAAKLTGKLPENVWVLPVYAIINPDLTDWLCTRLNLSPTISHS